MINTLTIGCDLALGWIIRMSTITTMDIIRTNKCCVIGLVDMVHGLHRSELEKAARGTRGACGHFFRIEDILVQKSLTYVVIADLCGDFDLFSGEY